MDELPIDHAQHVLSERATEDELDDDMTLIFWAWDGDDEDEEE